MAPVVGFVGNLGEHAVEYAQAGLEVFPVRPTGKLAKTPYYSQYQATTDEDQVSAWWQEHPAALIGHLLPAEQIILDVDPRHQGHEVFAALQADIGGHWPMTRCHLSGRNDGGGHTWWMRPADKLTVTKLDAWAEERGIGHEITHKSGPKAGQRHRWSSGIDILHRKHRYTILPPSPHPDTGRPYHWAGSNGLHVQTAPLPQLLVDLLTNDTPPAPQKAPRPPDADSIADWYSTYHRWPDLLSRHGWVLVGGDGGGDGSRWRHPAATNAFSATIRHGCLFVYSTSTVFEVTNPGDPRGYTVFAAWALLEHAGDQKAAASAARALKDGHRRHTTRRVHTVDELPPIEAYGTDEAAHGDRQEQPPDPVNLPEEFWVTRHVLGHIRAAAHSRLLSPDAVLVAVLARVAAGTPPTYRLPPVVGAPSSVAFYGLLAGPPGTGKSSAVACATDLLEIASDRVVDGAGLGSGEGLIELYHGMVDETDDNGKPIQVKRQVKNGAFVTLDEGAALAELGRRKGSTLLPILRSMWTGGTAGQANASAETRRHLKAGGYNLGFMLGIQPARAVELLADDAAGTPQRFVWARSTDPLIPTEPVPWPQAIAWEWSIQPRRSASDGSEYEFHLADEVIAELRSNALARNRGEVIVSDLDAHSDLLRLKVAALLAVLEHRLTISREDWHLAGVVTTTSSAVRSQVVAAIANEAAEREAGHRSKLVERDADLEAARLARERNLTADLLDACASSLRTIAEKAGATGVTRKDIRNAIGGRRRADLRRHQYTTDDVIAHATSLRLIAPTDDGRWTTGKARL